MKIPEFLRRLGSLEFNNGDLVLDNDAIEVYAEDKASKHHGVWADIKSIRLSKGEDAIILELEE